MSKRSRLFLILVIIAICFAFLWPSISWYALTPKEEQALALSSLENIKDYASQMAARDVDAIVAAAQADKSAPVSEEYSYLLKAAKKNYKLAGKKAPKNMTLYEAVNSFASKMALMEEVESYYREAILDAKDRYSNSVKLGLDLSGGMSIIIKADLDAAVAQQGGADAIGDVQAFRAAAMEQAIETLTSRIDKFGLSEPTIRQQGEDRIYIEIPGAADANRINSIVMGKGILNFRHVDLEATEEFNKYYEENPTKTFTAGGELLDLSKIPPDTEVLGLYSKDQYGLDQRDGYLVVGKEIILDGSHIKSAQVTSDNLGKPIVALYLDSEGGDIMAEYSGAHIGDYLGVVSDDKVKSYARIKNQLGESFVIEGFGLEEAQNLQKVLQSAWLNVPLTVESQQVVGASLGAKSIKEGLTALVVGLCAVLVFMLIWYKGAGVNAVVAQILNLYLIFSILSALNLTITLPSVAGMILTIGMAVDANVIIFERIKEELALGKSRSAAIATGFDHAFWAIMDSNITTFIAAIFLSQLGTGSIQGFAVSLAIGVCSSVFTALFVSRLMFDFNTDVMKHEKVSIGWRTK